MTRTPTTTASLVASAAVHCHDPGRGLCVATTRAEHCTPNALLAGDHVCVSDALAVAAVGSKSHASSILPTVAFVNPSMYWRVISSSSVLRHESAGNVGTQPTEGKPLGSEQSLDAVSFPSAPVKPVAQQHLHALIGSGDASVNVGGGSTSRTWQLEASGKL